MGDSFSWSSHSYTQFYMDDLEDQLTTAALRMLVKDLLVLFQAVNEGVINVLGKRCGRASRERLSLLDSFRALLRDVVCRCRTSPRYLSTFLQTSGICSRISRRGKKASKYPQCTHPKFKTCNVANITYTMFHPHLFTQAPVSLVGSLEEYLNDPNFEQNRIEYKANKDAADRNLKNGRSVLKRTENGKQPWAIQ